VKKLIETIPRRDQLEYVVAMDNYFTLPGILRDSRAMNVGIVGTARNRSNHPPKEMKAIDDKRFNSLYLMSHEWNFLCARWIDNNVVNMVSTIHTGYETTLRDRRRPRDTSTNRTHINQVWGKDPKVHVSIPTIIDDYNYWMLGVDKVDQYIAYYRPNIRCRRVWLPLMLQCMDIMRVNAFLAAKSKDENLEQKHFVEQLIQAFNYRATAIHYQANRTTIQRLTSPPVAKKRRRMGTKNPKLSDQFFKGKRS
jgi:Transposase IS4